MKSIGGEACPKHSVANRNAGDRPVLPVRSSATLAVVLCFAVVYLVWGATFAAIHVTLTAIPPFAMAALRFAVAGAALYLFLRWRGAPAPTARQWGSAAIIGSLLVAGGNGLVTWAQQTVPSTHAAIILATGPLWSYALGWLFFGGQRPTLQIVVGLAMGVAGVAVLTGGEAAQGSGSALHRISILLAPLSWAMGSHLARRLARPQSPILMAAQHMLAGSVVLSAIAAYRGEFAQVVLSEISAAAWWGFAYLVLAGSIVGLSCYLWLVKKVGASRASSHAFVNPLVAALVGYGLLGEEATIATAVGGSAILASMLMLQLRGSGGVVAMGWPRLWLRRWQSKSP